LDRRKSKDSNERKEEKCETNSKIRKDTQYKEQMVEINNESGNNKFLENRITNLI
jgi:hypothetical protein